MDFLVNRFDVLASQGCAANFFEKNHFFCYFFLVLFAYIKTKYYLCIRIKNIN